MKGELIVGELPPHLAQSMFSKPAKFPIAMRYSTEPGDPSLDDRIPQPRGLGMKVFNVEGEMFDEGKDYPTQDIEYVLKYPMREKKNANQQVDSIAHLPLTWQTRRQPKRSLTFALSMEGTRKSFTSILKLERIQICKKHETKFAILIWKYVKPCIRILNSH